MQYKKYRRTAGAVVKLAMAVVLAGVGLALLMTHDASAGGASGLLAIGLLVWSLAELVGFVAFEGNAVRGDSIPPSRVERAHATAMRYRYISIAGGTQRVCAFIISADNGEVVIVPRYGYFREVRRELFAKLDEWSELAGLKLDATTTAALERAKA